MGFFSGTPEKHERVSTLLPQQQQNFSQLNNAATSGNGGAFGEASNYYRNLLGNDSQDFNAFSAPQMRQFNEQTIPGIAEQFAGMGSGGLSSSGFRNASVNAGTDLAERLGSIRAQLRQGAAQGLQGIGQAALGNFSQDVMTQPGTEGLLSQFAPAIGTALGSFAGPAGAAVGGALGTLGKNMFGGVPVAKNSNPYGNQQNMPSAGNGFNLPNRRF